MTVEEALLRAKSCDIGDVPVMLDIVAMQVLAKEVERLRIESTNLRHRRRRRSEVDRA